jgi:hypothetical protein
MKRALALAWLALAPWWFATPAWAQITEDSDEWNCATMGNHLCGPGNSTGLLPGRYDSEGLFVEPWNERMRP